METGLSPALLWALLGCVIAVVIASLCYCIIAVKTSRKRLIQVQNAVPHPILWWDIKQKQIQFCNDKYRAMFRTESDAHPASWLPLAEKAFITQSPQEEEKHVVAGGERLLLHLYALPIPRTTLVVGTAQDKTSLEEASAELARYISAQSDLLESSSSAIAVYDRDARLQFYNQSFLSLWQLDEGWLGKHPTYDQVLELLRERRLLPEQANFPAFKKQQMQLFSNLIEPHNEYYYLPNDQVLRVLIIPQVLGGILFSYEDMTDRLVLERSYNTLIAVQRTTLDNLHESVAVFNQNGKLALFNAPFAKLWGFDQDYLASGPHIQDLLERVRYILSEDTDWQDYKARIFSPMNTRRLMQSRVVLRDGKVVERTIVPLPDGATMLSHLDVSDAMRAEQSLRERNDALEDAERMKSEFLAEVSYELRSPLTTIMGLTQLLEQKLYGDLNTRQKEYIDAIEAASQRLQYVINDILDLASLQVAGHVTMDYSSFDLKDLMEESLTIVNEQLQAGKLVSKWATKDTGFLIMGDTPRIKQMLLKLLHSIAECMATRTKLKIALIHMNESERLQCVLSFQCSKEGDAQHWLALDRTQPVINGNASLGFSIIQSVVALHHGELRIVLEKELGVRIDIQLPTRQMSVPA
jgi:signal transduction histidine kinase